jgi:hypothetical protein
MDLLPLDIMTRLTTRLKKINKKSGASEWASLCSFLAAAPPVARSLSVSVLNDPNDFDPETLKNRPLTINLDRLPHLRGAEGLEAFSTHMKALEEAGVHTVAVAGEHITDLHLARLPAGIRALTIDSSCVNVSDAGVSMCTGLKTLEIEDCKHLHGQGYENLKELTDIFAPSSGLDDAAVAHWAPLTRLTSLAVGGCEGFSGTSLPVLSALKELYVSGSNSLNEPSVAQVKTLEVLEIDSCDHMTGAGFVEGLPALKRLSAHPSDGAGAPLTLLPDVVAALRARGCKVLT